MAELLTRWDDAEAPPSLDEVEARIDRALFAELCATARESKVRFLRELTVLRIDLANARLLIRSRAKGLSPADIASRLIPGGSAALEALAPLAPRMSAEDLAAAIARSRVLGTVSETDLIQTERFDVAADTAVAERMRSARRAPGGAEPVLAYVLGREAEVLLLRTAVVGRLAGLDRESIRTHLKERLQ
jgi:vacuolar-type H+-ATPase subunit C/Vma6